MNGLKVARTVFLILFVVALLFMSLLMGAGGAAVPGTPNLSAELPLYISMFTSVITFLGFITTSILSFRREKREARDAELSQMQKEIELEKARLELDQLKKQAGKKKK